MAAGLFFSGCSSSGDGDVLVLPATTQPVQAPATVVVAEVEPEPVLQRQKLFAQAAPAATADCGPGLLDSNSSVSTVGLDEVLFGMTVARAAEASETCLVPEGEATQACHYVRPVGGPDGVGFMVTQGTIERVDIISGSITTRSGAGIGSTAQQILDLFPGKIETKPSPFGDGEWLSFIPSDTDDQQFRVVWETNNEGVVTRFRSGRRPQVENPSGCLDS